MLAASLAIDFESYPLQIHHFVLRSPIMTGNVDAEITKIGGEGATSLSDFQELEEWRTRSDLILIIENVPSNWMVGDLKTFLDGFGTVIKVEIFENREVLYSPPTRAKKIDARLEKAMAVEKSSIGKPQ